MCWMYSVKSKVPNHKGTIHKQGWSIRSEEHTSELQSRFDLVCRLLLEKKKRRQAPARGLAGTRARALRGASARDCRGGRRGRDIDDVWRRHRRAPQVATQSRVATS